MNDVPAVQWTDDTHELCRLFAEVHLTLGALYRYVIDLACSNPIDGGWRVRDARRPLPPQTRVANIVIRAQPAVSRKILSRVAP